ncbi:MAG: phage portal protein [Gemmatimonadales bacterium]|nr:MAG: phage portal protein [Gemmatimonadales bacterium]
MTPEAPEVKSEALPQWTGGSSTVDFWPHTADEPLTDLSSEGMRRVMMASYVLWSILRYRATKLVEAPPYVAREDGEGEPEHVDHELDELFREPNPDEDWVEIATVTQMLVDIDGQALWTKHRDNAGRVRIVRAYNADEFTVHPGETDDGIPRLYGHFRVQHSGHSRDYGWQDVVYFRSPHPYQRYETLSPTDAVLGMLGIAGDLNTRVKALIRNAAVPSGFFVRPEGAERLGDDEFARVKQEVNSQYSRTNSGRAGLLEGGLRYERTSMSLDDIKFGDLWREVEAACCAAFSLRPEVIGFLVGLENAPWSHMETARRLAYEDSAMPVWNFWHRTLGRQLLEPRDRDAGVTIEFDTSDIGVLKEDQDRASRIARRMGDDLSVNERRRMAGHEPTDKPEHDVVRGADYGTSRSPTEPETPPQTMSRGDKPEAKARDETRYKAWLEFDEFARALEPIVEQAAKNELQADLDFVLGLLDEAKSFKESEEQRVRRIMAMLNREYDQRRGTAWMASLAPAIGQVAERGARRLADRMGISFDLVTPGVARWAEEHAAEMVTAVSDTTKEAIRRSLADGLLEGEGIPEIAERIQQSGAFAESRATLIARTEATTTVNGAQKEALSVYASETGSVVRKTWLATQDDRTRDDHLLMDGTTVGLDDDFDSPDLGAIQYPQAPNCRCTLTYAIERTWDEDRT